MSFQGRSLDDLPLAAYTTGVVPDEPETPDPDAAAPAPMTAQEAILAAQAAPAKPATPAAKPDAKAAKVAPADKASGGRRPSFRLRLPGLPGRGKASQAAMEAAAPFQPIAGAPVGATRAVAGAGAAATPFQAVASSAPPPVLHPAPPPAKAPAAKAQARTGVPAPFQTVHVPVGPSSAVTSPLGTLAGRLPRVPSLPIRDPRVLAGGVVAIGAVLLVASLLGGGGPTVGAGGPGSSNDTTIVQPTAAPVGNATAELTSGLTGTYALSGATGSGPAAHDRLDATWTDTFGNTLGLSGMASAGTRTTDETFVLTWTVLVDGAPVTFTSTKGECTVGMALGVKSISGSYFCKQLKSVDGKHIIDANGTYKT